MNRNDHVKAGKLVHTAENGKPLVCLMCAIGEEQQETRLGKRVRSSSQGWVRRYTPVI